MATKEQSEYWKRYRLEKLDRIKAIKKEYYQARKKEIYEKTRAWIKRNPEKSIVYKRRWKRENKPIVNIATNRRRARIKMLPHDFDTEDWHDALANAGGCCVYCGNEESKLEQEHVIPVARGGGYVRGNIVPACRSCNAKKNDSADWIPN